MTVKHKCSKKVSDDSWHWHPCSRSATVERDGKWYCWQHDPLREMHKVMERRAAQDAKMNRQAAKYACRARNAELAQLVTPELANLLVLLADATDLLSRDDTSLVKDTDTARALADDIRKALEVN